MSADKTDAPAHTAAKTNTVSAIGSVSKVYCTTAAMQLYDKGLLDIDAPVTEYIPEFEMADERYKDITVRMLMNHTSGLMGMIYDDMMLYDDIDESYHDRFLGYLKNSRLFLCPAALLYPHTAGHQIYYVQIPFLPAADDHPLLVLPQKKRSAADNDRSRTDRCCDCRVDSSNISEPRAV